MFIFYVEMKPILFKDSANRRQNKINMLIFYVEMKPILSKDNTQSD